MNIYITLDWQRMRDVPGIGWRGSVGAVGGVLDCKLAILIDNLQSKALFLAAFGLRRSALAAAWGISFGVIILCPSAFVYLTI